MSMIVSTSPRIQTSTQPETNGADLPSGASSTQQTGTEMAKWEDIAR